MGKISRFVRKFRVVSMMKCEVNLQHWNHKTKIVTMYIRANVRQPDDTLKEIGWEVELTLDDIIYLRYPVLENHMALLENL